MDWLQFIGSVIGSLAWPVSVVVCVLLLRRELIQVLRRLKRIKYGDAEAEFGEKLEEVEQDIAELWATKKPPDAPEPSRLEFNQLDHFSNNSQVFVSWLEVESAILNLARVANLLAPNMPASRAAQLLLRNELIDEPTYRAIRELQELRNIAVHPSDARIVTREEADRFKKLSEKIALVLEDRKQAIGK